MPSFCLSRLGPLGERRGIRSTEIRKDDEIRFLKIVMEEVSKYCLKMSTTPDWLFNSNQRIFWDYCGIRFVLLFCWIIISQFNSIFCSGCRLIWLEHSPESSACNLLCFLFPVPCVIEVILILSSKFIFPACGSVLFEY